MLRIDYGKYSDNCMSFSLIFVIKTFLFFERKKFVLNNGLTDILGNSHNARTQHSKALTFNNDYYETEYNSFTLYRTITCSKPFIRIEL